FAGAYGGLPDAFAVNLRQIVIRQQEVNLIGEVALQFGGLIQRLPTVLGAFDVVVIAMDQLVQDQVPVGVTIEMGGGDELGKIGAVIVDVAGHPHFALV